MTKQQWQLHAMQIGFSSWPESERQLHASTCPVCKARKATRARNEAARAKHDAYTSAGMKRVKGAMGGTYYE